MDSRLTDSRLTDSRYSALEQSESCVLSVQEDCEAARARDVRRLDDDGCSQVLCSLHIRVDVARPEVDEPIVRRIGRHPRWTRHHTGDGPAGDLSFAVLVDSAPSPSEHL